VIRSLRRLPGLVAGSPTDARQAGHGRCQAARSRPCLDNLAARRSLIGTVMSRVPGLRRYAAASRGQAAVPSCRRPRTLWARRAAGRAGDHAAGCALHWDVGCLASVAVSQGLSTEFAYCPPGAPSLIICCGRLAKPAGPVCRAWPSARVSSVQCGGQDRPTRR